MTTVRRARTLRFALLRGSLLVVITAAAAMIGTVTLALSLRDAVERDSDAFSREQRIADQIGAKTSEQQLNAHRFLQTPDSSHLLAFQAAGDSVYADLRVYLFHELSADARLQVEGIKEAHQQFEVAAKRTFDLVEQGRPDAARRRMAGLDERAAELDAAVRRFRLARSEQRLAFRHEHEVLARRLRVALAVFVTVIVFLAALLGVILRRRVLNPLAHLASAARRLGEGEIMARVPPQVDEEFEVVARGFNEMADRVQESREEVVTQNRELHEALNHLRTTQEELVQHEKLSAMGQMLAGLAHELNNPLAGILGMSECLRLELADSPHASAQAIGRTMAEPLEREALRANALVRSLLSFARKPAGLLEPVGLAATVSTAVGLRAHAFAQADKTLHVDVSPDIHVIADPQKLLHAVVNLVNNALDAIVGGNGDGLTITATPDGNEHVCVYFDDDGPGMRDVLAVFAPFYTTKEAGKGTGIGLMLVQRFVQEFGGSVTAENRAGGGARLTLRLQRGASPSPALIRAEASRISGELSFPRATRMTAVTSGMGPILSDSADPPEKGAPRQRVLVVDDEPAIREIQRRLLLRAGLDVLVASSGVEARDLLLREEVDLVVSDLRMPGEMDGYSLFAWMERERPRLAASALLATGDMSGTASIALPVPEDRVLNKPFHGAEFVRRVQEALALTLA